MAVRIYSEWQQSNVEDERLQTEFQKAGNAALDTGLDLEQVYEDQDMAFFIQSGIKRGVAVFMIPIRRRMPCDKGRRNHFPIQRECC